jgi:4'-phosphopantetheinyl transferase
LNYSKPNKGLDGRSKNSSLQADNVAEALPENEVHIWQTDFATALNRMSSLHALLDHEEQERAARFKVASACEQFVISRAFLRIALGKYLGIAGRDVRFQIAEYGKPELASSSDIKFNLSHTDDAAVLAVTRKRPVGIDVERVRDNVDALELAGRFFSASEAQWLRSQPAARRLGSFFACWTAKEAYIKALGTGLSMPLAGFSIIPEQGNERLPLQIHGDPEASILWRMWQLDLGNDLRCAVAAKGSHLRVRLWKWAWPETIP